MVIQSHTTREECVGFVDEQDKIWAGFPVDKTGRAPTVAEHIIILRGLLAEILYRRCADVSDKVKANGGKGLEFMFGEQVEQLEQDGDRVHVTFAKSGERRNFDVVVGADGVQSKTRKTGFGEVGKTGIRCWSEGESENVRRWIANESNITQTDG